MIECIDNGSAYMKFLELIENQGGDVSYINDVSKFENAKYVYPILSEKTGFVKNVKAEKLGKISCELGAGRVKKEDIIDNQVGLIINKKIGDKIEKDEIIAIIHANDELKLKKAVEEIMDCFEICEEFVEKPQVILGIVE